MRTLEASLIKVQLELRTIKMTRLEKLQNIGIDSDETAKVLIYSDQGLLWIKNTKVLHHQKEMDKFIDNIVSKPRKKIKQFVAFVRDNYFAPEGVEVDNEDLIRRWNGAYEVLNVQEMCPELSRLDLLWTFLIFKSYKSNYSLINVNL